MLFRKYKIKRHLFSLSPRYSITDEQDQYVAEVNKHIFSFSKKATFIDYSGIEKLTISSKPFSFKPTYFIEKDGIQLFRIFKTIGFRPNIFVESLFEPDAFLIEGNLWRSEFAFYKNGIEFAHVSREIWKMPGTYGAAISEHEDQDIILALIIVIDLIRSRRRRKY